MEQHGLFRLTKAYLVVSKGGLWDGIIPHMFYLSLPTMSPPPSIHLTDVHQHVQTRFTWWLIQALIVLLFHTWLPVYSTLTWCGHTRADLLMHDRLHTCEPAPDTLTWGRTAGRSGRGLEGAWKSVGQVQGVVSSLASLWHEIPALLVCILSANVLASSL